MAQVRQERTGRRDVELARRHRLWGSDCPAMDIDHLVTEFDSFETVGLFEYKFHTAADVWVTTPCRIVLQKLAVETSAGGFVLGANVPRVRLLAGDAGQPSTSSRRLRVR